MKKTIISLFALTGIVGAAEFTSNTYLTAHGTASWTQTTPLDQSKADLYSAAIGKSSYTAVNTEFTAFLDGSLADRTPIYNVFNGATTELNSKSITLSALYNAIELDEQVNLVSYSFITRGDGTLTTGVKVKISDNQGNVLGYSDAVTYDQNATTNNGIYGIGTFTFSDTITLNSGTKYTYTVVNAADNSDYAGNFEYARFRTYFGSGNGWKINDQHQNGDYAVYSVKTQSVPEPTTATLSLLALAGLAARRRRK